MSPINCNRSSAPSRRAVVVGAGALLAMPNVARAQAWPSGNITIVVPFPAGGSTDAIARMAQTGLQQRLGVPVVVENRPGASGSVGTGQVAKAKADGNTWVFVFDTHSVNPTLYPSLSFDTEKDLAPVMLIGTAPHVVTTHPSKPWKSWKDVLAEAKSKAGGLNYGSIGTGSLGHLTMLDIAKRANTPFTHVPYRGGGPLLNDSVAGHIDLSIASTGLFGPQLSGGALRPLLQTGKTRLASLKDVPTAMEEGYAGLDSVAWWGVFGPAGIPEDVVKKFYGALEASLREPNVMKQMVENQQIDVQLGDGSVLKPFLSEQITKWGAVVRENGIKPGN